MLPQQLGAHNALSHKLTMKGPVCMCAVQLTVGYGTRSLMAHIQVVCVVKDVCVCVYVHAVMFEQDHGHSSLAMKSNRIYQ